MQDEVGYTLRVTDRVTDRDGASCPQAQEGKSVTLGRFDNSFKIFDLPLKGEIPRIPVRQAGTAGIVTNERMPSGQHRQPRATDGIVPIESQMTYPMRWRDQNWPLATGRKANSDAVAARAEADFLAAIIGHGYLIYVLAGYPAMFVRPWPTPRAAYGQSQMEYTT